MTNDPRPFGATAMTPEDVAAGLTKAQREALLHCTIYAPEWGCEIFLPGLIRAGTIKALQARGLFNRRSVSRLGLAVRAILEGTQSDKT